jgi:hypothetical protein
MLEVRVQVPVDALHRDVGKLGTIRLAGGQENVGSNPTIPTNEGSEIRSQESENKGNRCFSDS